MYYFQKGIRDNVNILFYSSLGVIFSVKHYAEKLNKVCKDRNIHVYLRQNLVHVDHVRKKAVFQDLDKKENQCIVDVSHHSTSSVVSTTLV